MSGVSKIHWISLRKGHATGSESTEVWLRLCRLRELVVAHYRISAEVQHVPGENAYVLSVGVPEGLNASKVYEWLNSTYDDLLRFSRHDPD